MIYGSISKNVLTYDHFNFAVRECNMLINKRPIAFKSTLVNPDSDSSVCVLTPEKLIRGFDVPSLAVVPHLHTEDLLCGGTTYCDGYDSSSSKSIETFDKLRKVKVEMNRLYYNEFVQNLRVLSTNASDRYKRRYNQHINVGDLVAVKHKYCKPYFYPLGVIQGVEKNDIDEVVSAIIRKGNGE